MQKRLLVLLSSFILMTSLSAAAVVGPDEASFPARTVLNKITYQATVEKWATATTANVAVNVDASLDKVGANVNSYVLQNLNKLVADAGWHITQVNRNQDKSGLEMLHVEAEARLPQGSLASLREKAKSISKAGETYTVGGIDFTPTLAEMEKTHADARADVYQQVKEEIARLNALYPDQHYFLHQLDFISPPRGMPMMAKAEMMAFSNAPAPEAPSIPVNAKITEIGRAVIAARIPLAEQIKNIDGKLLPN
jgi:hypothetical protein